MEEAGLARALESAQNGRISIENSNYAQAAAAFGEAASLCEKSLVGLYCTQASALVSDDKFKEAKKVADSAIRIAPKHSLSWYWCGTALFKLDQREKAQAAFKKAAAYETDLTKKTSYMDWAMRCEDPMDVIDATVPESERTANNDAGSSAARTRPIPPSAPEQNSSPKDKTRMNWYQSATHVNIDIYAKNVIQEQSSITIEDSRIRFQLKRPDTDDYILDKILFDNIVPAESSWNVNRFKFEARLKKASSGEPWRALDRGAEVVNPVVQAGIDAQRMNDARAAQQKEWKEYAQQELKDYKEDDSAMALFRTIYKDADDDMRRAMMKSYSESDGKVLSTNWEDVKKKKVEYKEKD